MQTGGSKNWSGWDDLVDDLCKEYGLKDLTDVLIDKLHDIVCWY